MFCLFTVVRNFQWEVLEPKAGTNITKEGVVAGTAHRRRLIVVSNTCLNKAIGFP